MYRNRSQVPASVAKLIGSQTTAKNTELEDYGSLSQEMLRKKLESVVRSSFDSREYPSYALTVDNLLKMSLVISFIRVSLRIILVD